MHGGFFLRSTKVDRMCRPPTFDWQDAATIILSVLCTAGVIAVCYSLVAP
jgi:hypothetical protein